MSPEQNYIPEDLLVDQPTIEVRWRLSNGALPFKHRHLRSFAAHGISNGLNSWARQHIEWTLAEGSRENPDAVLVIQVDSGGRAVMSLAPFEELPDRSLDALKSRAVACAGSPAPAEVLWWADAQGNLWAAMEPDRQLSGINSFVAQLADTRHKSVQMAGADFLHDVQKWEQVTAGAQEFFLVSDEFGVVPATGCGGASSNGGGASHGGGASSNGGGASHGSAADQATAAGQAGQADQAGAAGAYYAQCYAHILGISRPGMRGAIS